MVILDCRYSLVFSNLEITTRLIIDQLAIAELFLMHTALEKELDGLLEALIGVPIVELWR